LHQRRWRADGGECRVAINSIEVKGFTKKSLEVDEAPSDLLGPTELGQRCLRPSEFRDACSKESRPSLCGRTFEHHGLCLASTRGHASSTSPSLYRVGHSGLQFERRHQGHGPGRGHRPSEWLRRQRDGWPLFRRRRKWCRGRHEHRRRPEQRRSDLGRWNDEHGRYERHRRRREHGRCDRRGGRQEHRRHRERRDDDPRCLGGGTQRQEWGSLQIPE
jgi:hypothetical protein